MGMKKSDKKRQAILEAAYLLFLEKGFERTAVSEITTLVGGSKATIYSHFPSKETLFVECLFSPIDSGMDSIIAALQTSSDDVSAALRTLSCDYLRLVCSPEMISVRRLMYAEAERAGIGKMFYEKRQAIRAQLALYMSDLMHRGTLRAADPELAADQFRMLVETSLVEPLLLDAIDGPPSEEAIAAAADGAVETFLRAYATLIS